MRDVAIERDVLAHDIAHLRMRGEQHSARSVAGRQDSRLAGHFRGKARSVQRIVDRQSRGQRQRAKACRDTRRRTHRFINRPVVIRHLNDRRTAARKRTVIEFNRHKTCAAAQILMRIARARTRNAKPVRPAFGQIKCATARRNARAAARHKAADRTIDARCVFVTIEAPRLEATGQHQ